MDETAMSPPPARAQELALCAHARRDQGEGRTSHARNESPDQERHHARRQPAQGGPAREERERDEERRPPPDDVGESAVQRREGGGAEEVRRAEEAGLVRLLERRRDVRDEGRDLRARGQGQLAQHSQGGERQDAQWSRRARRAAGARAGSAPLPHFEEGRRGGRTKTPSHTAHRIALRLPLGSLVGSSRSSTASRGCRSGDRSSEPRRGADGTMSDEVERRAKGVMRRGRLACAL